MAEVKIFINGRAYDISCDAGQEGRVIDLAAYVDQKLQQISRAGAAYNDAHLMVLTTLVLTDELSQARAAATQQVAHNPEADAKAKAKAEADEQAVVSVIEKLTQRIDGIARRVAQAG